MLVWLNTKVTHSSCSTVTHHTRSIVTNFRSNTSPLRWSFGGNKIFVKRPSIQIWISGDFYLPLNSGQGNGRGLGCQHRHRTQLWDCLHREGTPRWRQSLQWHWGWRGRAVLRQQDTPPATQIGKPSPPVQSSLRKVWQWIIDRYNLPSLNSALANNDLYSNLESP